MPTLKRNKLHYAVLTAIFSSTLATNVAAEEAQVNTELTLTPVAVTGNPLNQGADELVVPVKVLNGRELSLKRGGTLGETLNDIPGVSSSGFGPNVGRPIIRGLDADRVRIMQNGIGNLDASSLSFDHAVSIDPLIVEQIDVVRGPAALLYGGSAVGGVVNTTDNRIPKSPIEGISGRTEARFGGPDNQRNGVVVIDAGNGRIAIHADAYKRENDDLRIPGFAVSERKNQTDGTPRENEGRLINSNANADGGAIGASATFDNGYIGLSYGRLDNHYGTVAEENVKIDMRSNRYDFASEFRDLNGPISRVKYRMAYTDYLHQEVEDGNIGTTFKNRGTEGALELEHARIGQLKGVVGLQFQNTQFQALGDEAFVPSTNTVSTGVYVYEDLPLTGLIDSLKLSFGGRHDEVTQRSAGGGNFGSSASKQFNPNSLAIGGIYSLSNEWSLASNLSHNERAPSNFELFANGPHIASAQYEIGNSNLNKERSNGIDAQLRWKQARNSFSIGTYFTRFNNYIGLFGTGNKRAVDGELNPIDNNNDGKADISGEDILTEAEFRAVRAVFKGVEMEGRFGLSDYLTWTVKGDYVRASNAETGASLPRISPLRLGTGLEYQQNAWGARLDLLHAFKQTRIDAQELPTDAYTLVNAMVTYKLPTKINVELFAKANNLLNEEIRESTSILKDISPAGERSLLLGLRADF